MTKKNIEDLSLERLIKRYLSFLEVEKNYSKYTIRNYGFYLGRFRRWFEKNYGQEYIQRLTSEMVRGYRLFLSRFADEKGQTLSRTTQSYYIISLRAFLKYLNRKGVKTLSAEKIDLPKGESRRIRFLSREQVERLLSMPIISKPEGLRDKAILEVLFSTGLRVSELVKLDVEDIDFKTREFSVVGKGRKIRVVFLSQRAAEWLRRYLDSREDTWKPLWIKYRVRESNRVVTSGESMRLSVRAVQHLVNKYSKRAGLPIRVSPHVLRHSFATGLLQNGADLRSVQEFLGHKNVSTTQVYTHLTNPQLKKVHEKFHG